MAKSTPTQQAYKATRAGYQSDTDAIIRALNGQNQASSGYLSNLAQLLGGSNGGQAADLARQYGALAAQHQSGTLGRLAEQEGAVNSGIIAQTQHEGAASALARRLQDMQSQQQAADAARQRQGEDYQLARDKYAVEQMHHNQNRLSPEEINAELAAGATPEQLYAQDPTHNLLYYQGASKMYGQDPNNPENAAFSTYQKYRSEVEAPHADLSAITDIPGFNPEHPYASIVRDVISQYGQPAFDAIRSRIGQTYDQGTAPPTAQHRGPGFGKKFFDIFHLGTYNK